MDSASPPRTDLVRLLAELCDAGVDFILVGALAAVAQGAPLTTHDVDIVHDRREDNVARLHERLTALRARYRGLPAERLVAPTRDDLRGGGQVRLRTDLGPIDVLGRLHDGRGFEDLVAESIEVDLRGRTVRVLGLEALVRIKRGSTEAKDKLQLAVLEETLRRRGRGGA